MLSEKELLEKAVDPSQGVSLSTALSKTIDSVTSRREALSVTRITTATTTTVLTGAGALEKILISTTAAGVITVYDNTAGSGTVVAAFKASQGEGVYELNVAVATGITVVTAAASDIFVYYRTNS